MLSTFDDVVGKWQIFEGERGGDTTLDCANVQLSCVLMFMFPTGSQLEHSRSGSLEHTSEIELAFPNVAVDPFGNRGTWTLIYNQGFEVAEVLMKHQSDS